MSEFGLDYVVHRNTNQDIHECLQDKVKRLKFSKIMNEKRKSNKK